MRKFFFAAVLALSMFASLAITVAADGTGGGCCH
jgi:hypothetical protein